ncbi:hypothetical protein [Planotetraspora kaengkrachanensis]|uniref:Uncharacterized protein n=1 Tax=Planotetraspora kaengkrachanensis TaxID=575193 RepID=A0A8J3PYT1_9ACTN|nr:hypothetical protein [Planotetraspora kaengkrachanensis]GIG83614.1 hypothetical protein Pka01_67410 [Planotetraspora kaengkrachanensis]
MKFRAELGLAFQGDLTILEPRLDNLMEQLLTIEECDEMVEDPDITATLTKGEAVVSMYLIAEDLPGAAQKLVATVRHAIHAIGDGTPGWEGAEKVVLEHSIAVRPADRALIDV